MLFFFFVGRFFFFYKQLIVNYFLTRWAKKSPRFADEKIFIFENITQMYPRGQSHLERDPAHLPSYWFMPTAAFLSEKDQAWENGVGSVGEALWFLSAAKVEKVVCDFAECRFWQKPHQQTNPKPFRKKPE